MATGLFVGVVNTFAGAAAAISIALYTALGLPINVANGTNRIPVLAQTAVMSIGFAKQGYLDLRAGLRLGVPTIIGAVIGAEYASRVSPTIFQVMLATILVLLLFVLIFNPQRFLNSTVTAHKLRKMDYVWFLLIGLYGGFFHIGVGYLIITASIMSMGYNLMQANALKGFIVMLYIPFTLAIFIFHGQVDFTYGLVHAVGNMAGAYIATHYAKRVPLNWIRWSLVVIIVVTILDLAKIISLHNALQSMFDLTL